MPQKFQVFQRSQVPFTIQETQGGGKEETGYSSAASRTGKPAN